MKIYTYSKDGYLTGQRQARANPKEKDKFLLPAMATDVKPPNAKKREIPRFDRGTESWEIVADLRGRKAYRTDTGQAEVVTGPGPLPDGFTLEERPSAYHTWNTDDQTWELKRDKVLGDVLRAFDIETKSLTDQAEAELIEANLSLTDGGEISSLGTSILIRKVEIRRERETIRNGIKTETAEQLLQRLTGEPE